MIWWRRSISPFWVLRTSSASCFLRVRELSCCSSLALVALYLFFMARMFSLMGISSLRKLSSSLTPSRSRISLSFSSLSSYSRYLISSWSPCVKCKLR